MRREQLAALPQQLAPADAEEIRHLHVVEGVLRQGGVEEILELGALTLTLPPPPRPCPVCGVVIAAQGDKWYCDGCDAWIHGECFWGRVASMDEWREFQRQLSRDDLPDDYCPPVLCGACREKAGA